ncbi:MAG TPA: hypothetical protein VFP54_11770 [Acidimicrobiales bacterium]|nr:hypothetical protein [Acidimicrobiales bacterium]
MADTEVAGTQPPSGQTTADPSPAGQPRPGRLVTRAGVAGGRLIQTYRWTSAPLALFVASRLLMFCCSELLSVFALPLSIGNFSGPWPLRRRLRPPVHGGITAGR